GETDLAVGDGLDHLVGGDRGGVLEVGSGTASGLAGQVGLHAVVQLGEAPAGGDGAVVGAGAARNQRAAPTHAHGLTPAEEDRVEGVRVARRVEHRLGKVAGSDLGLQLRLDVGVLDLRSVVGGRRSDGEPPGEAPAADG